MRTLIALTTFVLSTTAAQAQLEVRWFSFDAGGGAASSPTYDLCLSFGQPDAAPPLQGATYLLEPGFWPGVGAGSAGCGVADVTTTNTNPGDPGYGSPDGAVDGADLSFFVEAWLNGNAAVADVTTINTNPGDAGYGVPDGAVDGADLSYFVEQWLAGCP